MPSAFKQTVDALLARINALPAWADDAAEVDSTKRRRKKGDAVRTQIVRGTLLPTDQTLGDVYDGGTYYHSAKVEIEILVSGDADTRQTRLDGLLVALGDAHRTDATFAGACGDSTLQGATFDTFDDNGTGAGGLVAVVSLLIEYDSSNPLI